MEYDLSHLTQESSQQVMGPVQDDEALFLYGLIRSSRISRVLEVGGVPGYSTTNFLKAVGWHTESLVYTIDVCEIEQRAANHRILTMDVAHVNVSEFDGKPFDLIFFDCHNYEGQMGLFARLESSGLISERCYIVLHDTNLHPYKTLGHCYPVSAGWVHVKCERQMVNAFCDMGFHCIAIDTTMSIHDESLPYRHGLTVCRRFRRLAV